MPGKQGSRGRKAATSGGALGSRLGQLEKSLAGSHAAIAGAFERMSESQRSIYDRLAELEKKPVYVEKPAETEEAAAPEAKTPAPAKPAEPEDEDISNYIQRIIGEGSANPKSQETPLKFEIQGDLAPDDAYKIYVAAVGHRNAGRYSEALAMVAALKMTGKFAKQDFLLAELGALYTMMGDPVSAKRCLDEVLAMESCDADVKKAATHNMGRALEIEGNYEGAKKYAVAEKSAAISIV